MGSRSGGPVLTSNHSQHSRAPRDPLDDWSAAHVLASFNKFPIKTANEQKQAPIVDTRPVPADALTADISSASRDSETADLPSALVPFLTPSNTVDKPSGLSNCPGVTGIGGAMTPGGVHKTPHYEALGPAPAPISTVNGAATMMPILNGISGPPSLSSAGPNVRPNVSGSVNVHGGMTKSPADKEGAFKTTFQFVVNEDAKEARNTVRKHVMREYRRRERWEQGLKKEDVEAGDDAGGADAVTAARRPRKRARASPDSSSGQSRDEGGASSSTSESGRGESISRGKKPVFQVEPASKKRRTEPAWSVAPNGSRNGASHQSVWSLTGEAEEAIHELGGRHMLPYLSDPWAEVAAADIDPFSRLHAQLGPATQSLLHHFAWVMPSLMDELVTGDVFRRIGWLYNKVAVHDPTPAHVILGHTAAHLANLRGRPEPAFAAEHKAKALRLINARIEDPTWALSDGTLGAIVNVAGWELIDCNPQSFSLHMSGIHRILTTRGGLGTLAHNPELETVLMRLDAIRAYVAHCAPRFPIYTPMRTLPPLAIPVPSPYTASSPDPIPQVFEHIYCADAVELVHGIEDVLMLVHAGAFDAMVPAGEPFRQLLAAHTVQLLAPTASRLLSAHVVDITTPTPTQTPSPTSPNTPHPPAYHQTREGLGVERQRQAARTTRLAALLLIDLAVCEFFDAPPPPPNAKRRPPGTHTKRLKSRFLGAFSPAATASTPWGRSLEMVVAVLLQADRLALEKPWRAWYFADALTLTMALGADAWRAVGQALREYLEERVVESRVETPGTGLTVGGEAVEGLVRGEPKSRKVWDLKKQLATLIDAWGDD